MADRLAAPPVKIGAATWPQVAGLIGELADAECSADWYRRQVAAGALHPLAAELDGKIVAAALVRIDAVEWGSGHEFVIVAAAGGVPGRDLIAELLPELEKIAAASDCDSVRFHTDRRGLGAKAELAGYAAVETVYRKRFDDGRSRSRGSCEPSRAGDASAGRGPVHEHGSAQPGGRGATGDSGRGR